MRMWIVPFRTEDPCQMGNTSADAEGCSVSAVDRPTLPGKK